MSKQGDIDPQSHEDGATGYASSRPRSFTEKGRLFQRQQKEDKMSRLLKVLNKAIFEINTLLHDNAETSEVERVEQHFIDVVTQLTIVNEERHQLLDEEELEAEMRKFVLVEKQICETKLKISNWLKERNNEDHRWNLAESVKSMRSANSVASRRSSSSSAANRAMERKARLAALEQEKLFVRKAAEIERCQLQNEHSIKLLSIEKEVAMAKAELDVFEACDDEAETRQVGEAREHLSGAPNSFLGAPSSQSVEHSWMQRLDDTMKRSQLPKLELSVFRGDPLNFQQWMVSFEKVIEESTSDATHRLHYLLQFTSGEANVIVSGFALDQSHESYSNAKMELKREFGNPIILARSYLKTIDAWNTMKPGDGAALKSFAVFLRKCLGSLPSLQHLQQLNTDFYLQRIVAKLPSYLQGLWRKRVNECNNNNKEVDFKMLVHFIDQQSRILNDPVFSADALRDLEVKKNPSEVQNRVVDNKGSSSSKSSRRTVLSTATVPPVISSEAHAPTKRSVLSCPLCSSAHDLDDCGIYKSKSVEDRRGLLMEKRLCFCCYRPLSKQHNAKTCRDRRTCTICSRSHPTGLHGLRPLPRSSVATAERNHDSASQADIVSANATGATNKSNTLMSIVLVRLASKSNPAKEILVYAALDTLSSACFVTEDVWKLLNMPGEKSEITIKTIVSERKVATVAVTGLQVSSYHGGPAIQLPRTFTQPHLPVGPDDTPTKKTLQSWPHLQELADIIPEYDEKIPIGLLLGADCPRALQPLEVIASEDNGPFAMRTSIGWCVSGPAVQNKSGRCNVTCNRIQVEENDLDKMFSSLYEMEFNEQLSQLRVKDSQMIYDSGQDTMSCEDISFMSLMNSEVKFLDGHYQLPLPFKEAVCKTISNREQAEKRSLGLKGRFVKDSKFKEDYTQFMNDMIKNGFAEKANMASPHDQCWYIPHHGIYHPKKPDKIRVVFDCSCSYAGFCLNKKLMQGPNLASSLVGVLTRFRTEQFAFMADVDSMFYQVRIPEDQRSYVRFLWWSNGNTDSPLEDYQMCVHLFGSISSPSCANFALKRTADDQESKFGKEAADTLRRNFYVDDLLKSSDTSQRAQQLLSRC